ncbi:MAG: ABC transporter permease [Bryobacteraceae bacterium]
MLKDLRFAIRMLRKNPLFTAIAVFSLAIGIGANSAIFSLADAILLRPLPVPHPSSVVEIRMSSPSDSMHQVSYKNYLEFRDRNKSFDGMVALTLQSFGLSETADALPQRKVGLLVSGNFFRVLGVEPSIGRGFRDDEDKVPDRDRVVVLSHDLWMKQFNGNPAAVGQRIRLNGSEFTIVGVASESFTAVDQFFRPALYIPLAMAPAFQQAELLENRGSCSLDVKGRLKPGVSIAQAQADLATIAHGLEQTYPATNRNEGVTVKTPLQLRVQQSPPDASLIAMLLALAFCVLMVACANVAGLLLSRARVRSREIAVRLAIGASRISLIRQLLMESLLVALLGGGAGIVLAYGGVEFLSQIKIPSDLPLVLSIQLDQRVLLFTLVISVASTILFGLTPALRSTRPDLVPALKAASADMAGPKRLWGRNLLVIGQIALSLILLIVSGLLYKGFRNTMGGGPGFRTDHIIMMSFDPRLVRYTPEQTEQFYKHLIESARSIPGVRSAALTRVIPMSPSQGTQSVVPEGYQFPAGKEAVNPFSNTVDEQYFETIGIPLLRGRGFLASDDAKAPRVAVVNEAFAKRYWPNQKDIGETVGKRFRLDNAKGPLVQIVGIAKTTKVLWIAEPPTEFVYLPLAQNPESRRILLVWTDAADAASLTTPLHEAVRQIDSNQPVYDIRTMVDFYQMRAVQTPNMIIQTVGVLGLMGLMLAMVGLYGLVSYSVARRVREIGIRMAIGAEKTQVLGMVLRQGIILALIGVGIGLAGSVVAGRMVDAVFLASHHGLDPMVFGSMSVLMVAITMLATYAPARRASQVDPMRALRDE